MSADVRKGQGVPCGAQAGSPSRLLALLSSTLHPCPAHQGARSPSPFSSWRVTVTGHFTPAPVRADPQSALKAGLWGHSVHRVPQGPRQRRQGGPTPCTRPASCGTRLKSAHTHARARTGLLAQVPKVPEPHGERWALPPRSPAPLIASCLNTTPSISTAAPRNS